MYEQFKEGDTVKVWPTPGHRAPANANTPDRFIDPVGEEVVWSEWTHFLARSGAIVFSDPSEHYDRAQHQLHPHEWVAEHRKPAMHLNEDELAHRAHRKRADELKPAQRERLERHVAWHLVPEAR